MINGQKQSIQKRHSVVNLRSMVAWIIVVSVVVVFLIASIIQLRCLNKDMQLVSLLKQGNDKTVVVESNADNYYFVQVRLKDSQKEPPVEIGVWDYLIKIFGLPQNENSRKIIKNIVYDVRQGNPYPGKNYISLYNMDLYLALDVNHKLVQDYYEDDYTRIIVSSVDAKLRLYIDNNDYCEQNVDCVIRTSFCTVGSFNHYEPYLEVWGCPTLIDEDGMDYSEPNKELGCFVRVNYGGSACLQNKCVAQDKQYSCYK